MAQQTNFSYGLENLLSNILHPFMPGQRLDLIHGGILNPNVPGSLANSGYAILGKPFGMTAEGAVQDAQQGLNYAVAPATPAAQPFVQPKAAAASASGPVPFSAAAVSSIADWARNRGATISSYDRNASHNKDVGGVKNSYHLTWQAFDSTPPKGFSMSAWHDELKKRYPQYDVLNEGDHVHIEPPQGTPHEAAGPELSAFAQAAHATGLDSPTPALDTGGYQAADNLLQQAARAQMQPFSAQYKETPLPDLPAPAPLQAPDYSAGDAALAAAQPKNPFGATAEEQAQGQLKMRRGDYFAGMAQALASIDWTHGPGLGELFAKMGAGALMGAHVGDKEVQDRMDKFDELMQRYQLAVAGRDDTKARDAANVANQNITSLNQLARDKWQIAAKDIEAHNPRVENGVLITQNKAPDGTVQYTSTPLDPARTTAITMARANNAIAQGNATNEFAWHTYQANKAYGSAMLPYAMADAQAQGDPSSRDGLFAIGLAEGANAATETGQWSTMYQRYLPGGAEMAASRQREAYAAAGLPVDEKTGELMPGTKVDSQTQEKINDYISSKMMEDFTNMKHAWVLTGGPVLHPETGRKEVRGPSNEAAISVGQQRDKTRSVRRGVDSKGRPTFSETYGD